MPPGELLDVPIPSEKQKDLEGLTIIYVPTRKESVNIAKYLCGVGLKAAAYNASVWTEKSYFFLLSEAFCTVFRNENCQLLLTWL